jgi:hypothetical protein
VTSTRASRSDPMLTSDSRVPSPAVRGVLDYLRRRRPTGQQGGRPFVIEFAGSPNAGKDTVIEIVADYLRDVHGAGVNVVDEAVASLDRDQGGDRLPYVDQLHYTVTTTVHQLLRAVKDDGAKYDFVLVNRGLFDVLAQLDMSRARGDIRENQHRVLTEFVSYPQWVELTDVVFLMLVSPEESLRRERRRARRAIAELARDARKAVREQTIVNAETLALLLESYQRTYEQYEDVFPYVCRVDSVSGRDLTTLEKAMLVSRLIPVDGFLQLPIPALARFARKDIVASEETERDPIPRGYRWTSQHASQLALF